MKNKLKKIQEVSNTIHADIVLIIACAFFCGVSWNGGISHKLLLFVICYIDIIGVGFGLYRLVTKINKLQSLVKVRLENKDRD